MVIKKEAGQDVMQLEQVPNIVKLQLTVFLHAIKIYFKHDHDQQL